jgi:hypothetical protein
MEVKYVISASPRTWMRPLWIPETSPVKASPGLDPWDRHLLAESAFTGHEFQVELVVAIFRELDDRNG